MVNPALQKFVQSSREKGYSDETISKALINKGWQKSQVDEALANKSVSNNIESISQKEVDVKPFYKHPIFLGVIAIIFLLIIGSVVGYILLSGGNDNSCNFDSECEEGYECSLGLCVEKKEVECNLDSDCGRGYECSRNECVIVEDVECTKDSDCGTGYECSSNECIIVEDVECNVDSDCGEDYECYQNECYYVGLDVVDTENDTEETVTQNYGIESYSIVSLNKEFLTTNVTLSYTTEEEDENSIQVVGFGCVLSIDGTYLNSSAYSWEHTLVSQEEGYTCIFNAEDLYANVTQANQTANLYFVIDWEETYTESSEEDNELEDSVNFSLEDFGEESSETNSCTESSECQGYACDTENGVCYESCLDENLEDDSNLCADSYQCSSGICEEVAQVESCSDDSTCQEGEYCSEDSECVAKELCTTTWTDEDCESGYYCDTDTGYCEVSEDSTTDDSTDVEYSCGEITGSIDLDSYFIESEFNFDYNLDSAEFYVGCVGHLVDPATNSSLQLGYSSTEEFTLSGAGTELVDCSVDYSSKVSDIGVTLATWNLDEARLIMVYYLLPVGYESESDATLFCYNTVYEGDIEEGLGVAKAEEGAEDDSLSPPLMDLNNIDVLKKDFDVNKVQKIDTDKSVVPEKTQAGEDEIDVPPIRKVDAPEEEKSIFIKIINFLFGTNF